MLTVPCPHRGLVERLARSHPISLDLQVHLSAAELAALKRDVQKELGGKAECTTNEAPRAPLSSP